jgi:O-antigen/teichoic acid export membrane protein
MAQVATYGVSSVLTRAINFLLVPIYTAALTPDAYGVVSYLYALAAFLQVLCTWGLETAYFRKAGKQPAQEANYFATAQLTLVLCTLPMLVLLLPGAFWLSSVTIIQQPVYAYWLLAIIATDALLALPFARLRLLGMAKRFVVLKTLQVSITLLLNLWWVYLPHAFQVTIPFGLGRFDSIELLLLANFIANMLIALPLSGALVQLAKPIKLVESKAMLQYGFPLMLMGLAGMVNEVLDRILLEVWLPPTFYGELSTAAAIGIYSGCYKLSILITLGIQAFRYAVEPYFFQQVSEKDAPEQYARIMHLFVLAASFAMLAIFLQMDVLKHLLRQEVYFKGLPILIWLLPANVLLGIYFNLSVWYKVTDKTYYGAILSVLGAAVTFIANFFLIPLFGFEGSAIATLCCYASMTIGSYIFGKKHYAIPYEIKFGLLYLSSAWLLGFVFVQAKEDTLFWNLPVPLFLLSVWGASVWWLERTRLAK